MRPDPPREQTRLVITLVHGTFAKHAPWMRDDSELCKALQDSEGTAFRRFCWSGGNSHSARLQAGDDLALFLREVRTQFPDNARHFVIAHSHGGNVAMYAMESESADGKKLGEEIAGVITLATPFITLRKRQLPKFVIPSALFAIVFVAVVSIIALRFPPKPPDSLSWATVGGLTTLFLIWLAATLGSAKLYDRRNFSLSILWQIFRNRHKPEQALLDAQLRPLQPQSLDADKLLVMRPLGDEANMSLVVSQFLSWMQNKILSFLQGFQDGFLGRTGRQKSPDGERLRFGARLRAMPAGCFFTMLKLGSILALVVWVSIKTHSDSVEKHAIGVVISAGFDGVSSLLTQGLLLIPVILFAGLLAFFVIFGLLSLYALIGLLLAAAPFGWDAMFWNHFTSTTAEPAPVGKRPAQIFHAAAKDGSVDSGLAHSGIYINPVAIAEVVHWIGTRSAK